MSEPIPHLSPRPGRDLAALHASRAVVGLYLRARSTAFSVRELAAEAGISERSFYRYFPRKEDAIRPYLEAGLAAVIGVVAEAPPTCSLREALVRAHTPFLDAALVHDGAAFLRLLHASEPLRAVWLQVLSDAEDGFAAIVAVRRGLDPTALEARFVAGAIVSAGRVALEHHGNETRPSAAFAACLAQLSPGLFGDATDTGIGQEPAVEGR